ncbi:GIY-YIG nuclease family protein [Bifidobacterium jacchi]|uniref:GIY-YIG nuclease family protein n=1 Tax=Bifidobacterium jacchi TaxID=2490545 RepID=A0A5N5RNR9_9BIFI|nr:GIY-YIG nuclease family protein [Bifidobacterium jacchi]KAB5608733.1 GIY-YIG nuclease family protein [Bifidobacterium jacchi]
MVYVQSRHVSLFLVEGTFGGIVTAEIMNWTGHVLKGRRSQLSSIYQRDEAKRPGVYILTGEDDEGPLAYIGQTDCIAERLKQHNTGKEFWDEVVFVTSKDSNLTSAHVRYLEARLYQRAMELKRIRLDNGNEPKGGAQLPDADRSDMDYFFHQILILLPVLGVEFLRGKTAKEMNRGAYENDMDAMPDQSESPVFMLSVQWNGVSAKAQIVDGEFTVLADSLVACEVTVKEGSKAASSPSYNGLKAFFQRCRDDGTIVANPGNGHLSRLTRNVQFSSPSAAAAFVKGNVSANGRKDWKTTDGRTYAAWEATNG